MNYQQLAQQYAQDLISSIPGGSLKLQGSQSPSPNELLDELIDAFPCYQDPTIMGLHRSAVINILENNLPNDGIVGQPNDNGWDYNTSYTYNGSYSGYQDAFYSGVGLTANAHAIWNQFTTTNPPLLNEQWWNNFAVAVLTDAVRMQNAAGVNTGSLATALTNFNTQFNPGLAPSYLAIFSTAYPPTQAVFQNISGSNQSAAVCNLLASALTGNSNIVTNLNIALSQAGDSATAASWFIFNLWNALTALNCNNIDTVINGCGINLPGDLAAGNWWTGGYISWFNNISGTDVLNDAGGTITASMPEQSITYMADTGGQPEYDYPNESNGYSQSLCNWGPLNNFNPPPSSCFGRGTMVLMADGSQKPIESVTKGDFVYTQLGPRKVVICEAPKRQGRKLYSFNGLNFAVTAAHPLIAADDNTGKYYAVDPWGLIDGVPTATYQGVASLKSGCRLQAIKNTQHCELVVNNITESKATTDDECVYDLILENWEVDFPQYYVGGPDYFIATEAETTNPLREPLVSAAVITMLNTAVGPSRENIMHPEKTLPRLIRNINPDEIKASIYEMKNSIGSEKTIKYPAIPKPEFYYLEDKWDPHASLLEYYIVRYYGRWLRSELVNGWRTHSLNSSADRLILDLNDLELVEQPFNPKKSLGIIVTLTDKIGRASSVINHSVNISDKPLWRICIDKSLSLGTFQGQLSNYEISGEIRCDNETCGKFTLNATGNVNQAMGSDFFIYNDNREVIGRINLGTRLLSGEEFESETQNAGKWSLKNSRAYSIALGSYLGNRLRLLLEKYKLVGNG